MLALAPAAFLLGCERKLQAARPAEDSGAAYLAPPTLKEASRGEGGGLHLEGHAPAGAVLRLRSPEGGQATVRAGPDGAWALELPASDTPRLYAFEAEVGARTVRGEGALAIMPPPSTPALVLRAGFAATTAGVGAPGRLQLVDIEFNGGGLAAGGFAPPGSPVRLTVDGAVVGVAQASATGHFAILAADPRHGVPNGGHRVRVETPQGLVVERRVDIAPPMLPADRAYTANSVAGGWSLNWRLPGGGGQTSLIFDDAVNTPTGRTQAR